MRGCTHSRALPASQGLLRGSWMRTVSNIDMRYVTRGVHMGSQRHVGQVVPCQHASRLLGFGRVISNMDTVTLCEVSIWVATQSPTLPSLPSLLSVCPSRVCTL